MMERPRVVGKCGRAQGRKFESTRALDFIFGTWLICIDNAGARRQRLSVMLSSVTVSSAIVASLAGLNHNESASV